MSPKHNATGRTRPSRAERQAQMRQMVQPQPKPESKVDDETRAEIDKELAESQTKVQSKPAEPTKTNVAPLKPIDPNRGMATRIRWSAVLKSRPGAKLVMPADIKVLPDTAVVTSLRSDNPKKRMSLERFERYGFKGLKGATTTIGAYRAAVAKMNKTGCTDAVAIADIAWDINHGFIEVEVPNTQPVEEPPAEQEQAVAQQEPQPEEQPVEDHNEVAAQVEDKPEDQSEAA